MAREAVQEESGRLPSAWRLVRVALGLVLLSIAGSVLNDVSFKTSGVSLVWLSNGLLIGVLLCAPRRHWIPFLALGFVIDCSMNLAQENPLWTSIFFSLCNVAETLIAAALMYTAVARNPDLTEARQLRSLLLYGVFTAPAVASVMASVYLWMYAGTPFRHSLQSWFAADVLGIAMITPLYFSQHYGRTFSSRSKVEVAGLFLLLAAMTLGVFGLSGYPLLWLVLLVLLLLGVRLGFTASAAGLLLVTILGGYLTVKGYGPLMPRLHGAMTVRILFFQAFIGFSMLALYVTEVARSASRRIRVRLEASEARFRSLAEASRDVIVLAELNGNGKYVSPAITELLGWTPDDLIGHSYGYLAHQDDGPKIDTMLEQMRAGNDVSPLAYRARKQNGSYLWLESTARLLRNEETEEPYGFVYVLRDISDRKAAEEKMKHAYEQVERLAMMDGLTGVANRRLLDQTLAREWISSRRDRTPLSILLIDVDLFKSYNDFYGHPEGDDCLRQVATNIQTVLRRPLDMLARYGGEEFVAVLPNTPADGAVAMAEMVRKTVEDCCMSHSGSPHRVVTVSVGCGTQYPGDHSPLSQLLKMADAALYRAKSNGRNCIESAAMASAVSPHSYSG